MADLSNGAATATASLIGSVAAVATSPLATADQRAAALQYLAALANFGVPAPEAAAAAGVVPPPVTPVAAPAAVPAAPPSGVPGAAPAANVQQPARTWYAGSLFNEVPDDHVAPIPDTGDGWYVVTKGKAVGVTQSHAEAMQAVVGITHNSMKSYKTLHPGLNAFNSSLDAGLPGYIIGSRWLVDRSHSARSSHARLLNVASILANFPMVQDTLADSACAYTDAQFDTLIASLEPRSPSPNYSDPECDALINEFIDQNPPPSPSVSATARVYSDEEFAALLDSLSISDTPPPRTPSPPGYLQTPPRVAGHRPLYRIESPAGITHARTWGEAGMLTQGVAGTHVRAVEQRPRKKRFKIAAYVVFFGRAPGVVLTWSDRVSGVRNAIQKGYRTVEQAEAAYAYAVARSWTRVCGSPLPSSSQQSGIPILPSPADLPTVSTHFTTWYIVYRGITPGVYHSILECLLNTTGICNSFYDSVEGREAAVRTFDKARRAGHTAAVPPPSYERSTYDDTLL
ncbi:hypothetical protein DFH07DRAFT_785981 [Mycena maculata]|uniref:Ribonuclease H1 N-terminal domain-containing protein n=1 Tax=Mycena maculata TaxID=230809 RepID=A0AAD7MDX3_9AGAR|nr:hypothetical protein DFH07DRAFT_785981 [Mycena maculata]